jgi:iron complex outermembrane receptor protein
LRAASNFTLKEDELFLRLSGMHNERDGYVDNYDTGCLIAGGSLGDCQNFTLGGLETTGGRAALRWLPSDSLEINFSTDYLDDQSEPVANVLTRAYPTAAPIFGPPATPNGPPTLGWPWANPFPAGTPPQFTNNLPTQDIFPVFEPGGPVFGGFNPCVFNTTGDQYSCPDIQQQVFGRVIDDGYSSFSSFNNPATRAVPRTNEVQQSTTNLNIDWEFAEDMQLQSITAYRQYEIAYGTDDDATPWALTNQFNTQEHSAISQELRLNGLVGDSISYAVGAFYQETETEIGGDLELAALGLDFVVDDVVETTSYAAFANVIWSVSDQFEVTGGLRFSDDEKTFNFTRLNSDIVAAATGLQEPVSCLPIPGTNIPDPGSLPNCLVGGINDTPPQVFEDDRLDYRLAASYFLNDDVTFYLSTATGYKAGGANSRPFFESQIAPHNSEELTSYELGAKIELLDNTLRLNTAVFTNDYEDVIVTLFDCTTTAGENFGSPCFLPANAGTAEVSGFELEFDWLITDSLYVDGSYSYVDFEYTEGTGQEITVDTVQAYTPEQTWSLGIQYDFNLGGSAGKIMPRIDVVYQDDIFTQPENVDTSFIEAYTLVNATVRWTSEDELWSAALSAQNVTDEYYYSNVTDQAGTGYAAANPAPPRTWTFSVRRNFF